MIVTFFSLQSCIRASPVFSTVRYLYGSVPYLRDTVRYGTDGDSEARRVPQYHTVRYGNGTYDNMEPRRRGTIPYGTIVTLHYRYGTVRYGFKKILPQTAYWYGSGTLFVFGTVPVPYRTVSYRSFQVAM